MKQSPSWETNSSAVSYINSSSCVEHKMFAAVFMGPSLGSWTRSIHSTAYGSESDSNIFITPTRIPHKLSFSFTFSDYVCADLHISHLLRAWRMLRPHVLFYLILLIISDEEYKLQWLWMHLSLLIFIIVSTISIVTIKIMVKLSLRTSWSNSEEWRYSSTNS